MKDEVMARDEFIVKAKISEQWLKEMENAKIIEASGFTENNIPFYTSHSIDQSNHIKKLIDLGYTPETIGKITKKFGFPRSGESGKKASVKKRLTIGGLAERIGVSTRTIKHWEEMGIIEADMRSEGGFRLYSEVFVYLCNLIKDLQLFGYSLEQIKKISDLFRTFLTIEANINHFSQKETDKKLSQMLQEIKLLLNKIKLLKKGINRWEVLLNKKSKELNVFLRKNEKRLKPNRVSKNG